MAFLTPGVGVGSGLAAALATDSKFLTLACRIRRPAPPELADKALSASFVACLLVACAVGCLAAGAVGVGMARPTVGDTLAVGADGKARLLRGSFGVGGSGGRGGYEDSLGVGGKGGRGGYEGSLGVGGSGGYAELSLFFFGAGRGGGILPPLELSDRGGSPRPIEFGEPTGVLGDELITTNQALIERLNYHLRIITKLSST